MDTPFTTFDILSQDDYVRAGRGYGVRGIAAASIQYPGITDKHKLRWEVYRDAYDFQSYARIEAWDGARWNELDHLPAEEFSRDLPSYVLSHGMDGERSERAHECFEACQEAVQELIRRAHEVLS